MKHKQSAWACTKTINGRHKNQIKQSTSDDGGNRKQQINVHKRSGTKEHNKNNKKAWRKTQFKQETAC